MLKKIFKWYRFRKEIKNYEFHERIKFIHRFSEGDRVICSISTFLNPGTIIGIANGKCEEPHCLINFSKDNHYNSGIYCEWHCHKFLSTVKSEDKFNN